MSMVLVLTGLWIRSSRRSDSLVFPVRGWSVSVWSNGGFLGLHTEIAPRTGVRFRSSTIEFSPYTRWFRAFILQPNHQCSCGQWKGIETAQAPIWAAQGLAGIPVLMSVSLGYWRLRRRSLGKCSTCNYDLTGNVSGRCPECGCEISIDRTDESSAPAEPS